jgi:hypothetical protein
MLEDLPNGIATSDTSRLEFEAHLHRLINSLRKGPVGYNAIYSSYDVLTYVLSFVAVHFVLRRSRFQCWAKYASALRGPATP